MSLPLLPTAFHPAYVAREKEGLIQEKPLGIGEVQNQNLNLDIEAEVKLVQERLNELNIKGVNEAAQRAAMKELGLERARIFGWPNTYVFTKAMGEMLIGNFRESLPLVIVRPTIITSTYKDPFPGWIEGIRTVDAVILNYAKGNMKCFMVDPNSIMDAVFGLINGALCQLFHSLHNHLDKNYKRIMQIAKLYEFYAFFKGRFDDSNSESFRKLLKGEGVEENMFQIDPKCIDWEDYFITIHLPGVVKYLIK